MADHPTLTLMACLACVVAFAALSGCTTKPFPPAEGQSLMFDRDGCQYLVFTSPLTGQLTHARRISHPCKFKQGA